MAHFTPLENTGYSIPQEISPNSSLRRLLIEHQEFLAQADQGDPLNRISADNQPQDHKLGRMELFEILSNQYTSIIQAAAQHAITRKIDLWNKDIQTLNEYSLYFDQLGYPSSDFHVDFSQEPYLSYYFRMIDIIEQVPESQRRGLEFFTRVYQKALPSCQKGGLGLDASSNAFSPETAALSTLKSIEFCEQNSPLGWGVCINQTYQTALLMYSALSIYQAEPNEKLNMAFVSISNQPFGYKKMQGHLFFSFYHEPGNLSSLSPYVALDPSEIGFKYINKFQQSYSMSHNLLRTFLSDLYGHYGIREENREAIESFELRAVELRPNSLPKMNLAQSLIEQRKLDEANQILQEIVTQEPNNILFHFKLFLLYLISGKSIDAAGLAEKFAALGPESPTWVFLHGMALLAQKKDQEAIKAFDKTTMGKLDKPLAALIGTLYVYRHQGSDELSRKLADCLKSPSPALVSIGLGMLNRADGALKTMRENFNQAIQVSTITEQEKSFAQGQLDQIIQQRKKHSLFMNWIEDLKKGWQLESD